MRIRPVSSLKGHVHVPGDKSISHRAVMLGAIANGITEVSGFLPGEDCLSSVACVKQLGVHVEQSRDGKSLTIHGNGTNSLKEPDGPLYVGNSGTTIRLMTGMLAAQPFFSVLYGDESIAKRPMKRIIEPLRQMGANVSGRSNDTYSPLAVKGTDLRGINYDSKIASAQVKSAVLLAGLQATGQTSYREPFLSRDHTERMFRHFGVKVESKGNLLLLEGGQRLTSNPISVPGDISSAAFIIAAALITSNSEVRIENVGINPTRTGFLEVLLQMGANIEIRNKRQWGEEPVADLHIASSTLKGIEIKGSMIPRIIDELPILAVVASQAEGKTVVRDAEELRVKETDRIATVSSELTKFGAKIVETSDGFIVTGKTPLTGCEIDSHGDHRVAMAMAVAGLIAEGTTTINDSHVIDVSFPGFDDLISRLS